MEIDWFCRGLFLGVQVVLIGDSGVGKSYVPMLSFCFNLVLIAIVL